jgi:ribonuclease P protein component
LVFKKGLNAASKHLVIYARLNELTFTRLGLSVGKKIGKAVMRNRIKRLLKEAMRKVLEELPLHYDFVIVAKRPSAEGTLDDFIREIKKFLPRLLNEKNSDLTCNVI